MKNTIIIPLTLAILIMILMLIVYRRNSKRIKEKLSTNTTSQYPGTIFIPYDKATSHQFKLPTMILNGSNGGNSPCNYLNTGNGYLMTSNILGKSSTNVCQIAFTTVSNPMIVNNQSGTTANRDYGMYGLWVVFSSVPTPQIGDDAIVIAIGDRGSGYQLTDTSGNKYTFYDGANYVASYSNINKSNPGTNVNKWLWNIDDEGFYRLEYNDGATIPVVYQSTSSTFPMRTYNYRYSNLVFTYRWLISIANTGDPDNLYISIYVKELNDKEFTPLKDSPNGNGIFPIKRSYFKNWFNFRYFGIASNNSEFNIGSPVGNNKLQCNFAMMQLTDIIISDN